MSQDGWNDEGVGDENRAYVTKGNWKDNNAMVDHMRKLQTTADGAVNIPGDDATDDDRKAFYKKMGRPDTVGEYTYKMSQGGDEAHHKWFTEAAHKLGLSDKQVTSLGEQSDMRNKEAADNNMVKMEAEVQALKNKYGTEFDAKITKGKKVVSDLGLSNEALSQIEKETGSTAMVDLFIRLGDKIGEGTFNNDNANPDNGSILSKAQAIEALNSFDNDLEKQRLYKLDDPKTVAWRRQLYKIAYD